MKKAVIILAVFLFNSVAFSQDFSWAKSFGGFDLQYGRTITTDDSGNVYVSGPFAGTIDFDLSGPMDALTSNGDYDVFIAKLDLNGNLLWAKTFGGFGNDRPMGIKTDSQGNSFTTGYFQYEVDFDPGAGSFPVTSAASKWDCFIVKLDPAGNFSWMKKMGGNSDDYTYAIDLDNAGNIYTTGVFADTADFDPGINNADLIADIGGDVFVSKLDASGNFLWAKNLGGIEFDQGYSIDADAQGNVHITGYFRGEADFDPGNGVYNLNSNGSFDVFISKLDPSGNFLWAKNFGGAGDDKGFGVAVDVNGNVFASGTFQQTADFDPASTSDVHVSAGNDDIYIVKFDASGSFLWARTTGGADFDRALTLAIDPNGNVYSTGYFRGAVDFDMGAGTQVLNSDLFSWDVFISKLNSAGNYVWAGNAGGSQDDYALYIAVDDSESVYITGEFNGIGDFDPGVDVFDLTSAGNSDAFVVKIVNKNFVAGVSGSADDSGILSIYPNPVNDKIKIESSVNFSNTTFKITDLTGRLVFSGKLNGNLNTVDFAEISGGTYILTVDGLPAELKRIIKQ